MSNADSFRVEQIVRSSVEAGKHFTAGLGPVPVGIGQFYNFMFTNPVGSGIRAYLTELLMFSETKVEFAEFRANPTVGLPTTERAKTNSLIGGPASSASMKIDVAGTSITGGSLAEYKVAVPPADRISVLLPPLIVSPGISLSLSIPNTSGGVAQILGQLRWAEVSI